MTHNLQSVTTATVGLALDAATLRHQAIANNIANVNTEGYVPVQINFASYMEQLEQLSAPTQGKGSQKHSIGQLELEPVFDVNGNPAKVSLDTEVAAMAHNTVQYQALIKALNRHYAIMSSAVTDGKK
ncbi:flagellar basal body rod protein FlgB [Undibacterium sp. KW1]|uniref:flagellar basal body rod protein FlgB n=1 Tax=Undibacterium sp. KW1 TaxID=2058624 RepID=UPI001331DCD2|nr:flagellar basal body protein [Undibacterium sp. KW1]BBB62251.1 flagellar basal body rod protein FlgB [Undibacterium sp. KW1]